MDSTVELQCTNCGITYTGRPIACPGCGSELRPSDPADPNDEISLSISFTVWECNSCGAACFPDPEGRCPRCGHQLRAAGDVDQSVGRRRAAFGPRVEALGSLVQKWQPSVLRFAQRGRRAQPPEYLFTLSDVGMTRPLQILDSIKRLLRETRWDPEEAPNEANPALDQIVDLTTQLLAIVRALTETPPPLVLLEVHREATRSLSELSVAIGRFVETLVAPSFDQARRLQQEGQAALDRAAGRVTRILQVIERLDRMLELAPGWWTVQGEYDTGRVAWEAMDRRVGTISAAADLVRSELGEVPGVAQLPDEYAALLLPALSAVSFQDPLRLVRKATLARSLLDKADSANPSWIADPALLTQNVWRGHRQLIAQVVRLGFALRTEAPRNILLETAIGVYQKLVEGPLLNLGLPALLASKVANSPSLTYDVSTCEPIQVGELVDYFVQQEPPLSEGAEMLLRNADAHYDFELTDQGIEFRDRRIRGGKVARRRLDYLLDDDFLEQLLTLNETLVALELAALPYLWQHASPVVSGEIDRLSRTQESRIEQLRFLAGLQGFVEIEIRQHEGALVFRARYEPDGASNPFLEIQPTVAAAWTLWDDITRVRLILEIDGQGRTCDVDREDFPGDAPNVWIRNHAVALHIRHLRTSTEVLRPHEVVEINARFALLPGIFYIREGLESFADTPTVTGARNLVAYFRWLREALSRVPVAESLTALRDELLKLARGMARELNTWMAARNAGNMRLAREAMRRLGERIQGLVPLSTRITELLPNQAEEQ